LFPFLFQREKEDKEEEDYFDDDDEAACEFSGTTFIHHTGGIWNDTLHGNYICKNGLAPTAPPGGHLFFFPFSFLFNAYTLMILPRYIYIHPTI
jgi:hypothetical protein